MQVLISPEASKLVAQAMTSDGTNEAVADAIRIDLDRLRKNEYYFCTHKGAKCAVSTYGGTSLSLYFSAVQNLAVLFDSQEQPGRFKQEFIDALIPLCTPFNVL